MANFMGQHGGQFALAVQVGEQAAVDIDKATGQREGVDVGAVDHRKGKGRAGIVAVGHQALAHPVHVGLQLRVVVGGLLGEHFLVHGRAGGGVAGAAGQQGHGH